MKAAVYDLYEKHGKSVDGLRAELGDRDLVLQPHIWGFITSKEATEVNLALHTRRNPCPRRLLRAPTEAVECDLRL